MKTKSLTILLLSLSFSLIILAQEHEEENENEVQQFLFYMDEAYIQEEGEFQLNLQYENWHFKENNDTEIEEILFDNYSIISLEFEYGLLDGLQLEIGLPLNFVSYSGESDQGFGDLSAEFGYSLQEEDEESLMPTISLSTELVLPTGEWKNNFGTGGYGLQLGIQLSKNVEDFVIHLNTEFGRTFNTKSSFESDETEFEFRGALVYRTENNFDFILETGIEIEFEDDETETSSLIIPGCRYEVFENMEIGLGIPIILSENKNDYRIILKTQFEW